MHFIKIQIFLIVFAENIVVFLREQLALIALEIIILFLLGLFGVEVAILDFLFTDEIILLDFEALLFEFVGQLVRIQRIIEVDPEFDENLVEVMVLLFHFLMVAAALLGLSSFHKISHAFEYFIGPAQMLEDEMAVVDLQEEVVEFVFFMGPMTLLDILRLFLSRFALAVKAALHGLFFVLLLAEFDVALLPEKGLEVVAWDYLFLLVVEEVVINGGGPGMGDGGGGLVIGRLSEQR